MAFQGTSSSSALQHSSDTGMIAESNAPQSEIGDAGSILSSRMTDIVSDDGEAHSSEQNRGLVGSASTQRQSLQTSTSRPNTAATGVSSQRGVFAQGSASRRAPLSGAQRGSGIGNLSGSVGSNRPLSAARSHVPSLSSHAFFRPMSSQKLQAQRGGSRPPTMAQQESAESAVGGISNVARHSIHSTQTTPHRESTQEDLVGRPPPSRGTEVTEQETLERVTANTSPTHGHHAGGSLSESVRPLQRPTPNLKGLSVNVERNHRSVSGLAAPSKSPRSFRSSFLLPSRGDASANSPGRSTHGREKLASVASSPGVTTPVDGHKKPSKQAAGGNNHEYFTGNTVFCWGGRLQNTRHKPINVATGLLVIVPAILFLVYSAPYLWHHVSPAIPITFGYILFLCVSSFVHASVSDPGILPRNLHPMPPPDENEDPLRLGPSMNDWTMIKSAQSETAAMEVPTKYCKTCNIWRPARGHHCRICDNCIETQDHHCVWLNNCVGRRNYRFFFTFVTTCTILGAYLLAASLAQILVYRSKEQVSFGDAIDHWRIPFAMFIYGIIATPYPAALMVYHLFLMGRGETTREYLNSHKFLKKDRHRPFTQGNIFVNWFVVLCRPRPPTYLNFKKEYIEGDRRFGERRGRRTAPLAKDAQGGNGVDLEMQDVSRTTPSFQSPSALRDERR